MTPAFATAAHALRHWAESTPDAPALITPAGRLSFAAWWSRSRALASMLDIRRGERIALLAENRLEWPVAQMAVALRGAVLVPVSSRYRRAEIGFALARSGAVAVLASGRWLDDLSALQADLPSLRHVISLDVDLPSGAGGEPGVPSAEDDALLLFTSGTTGAPKGALVTHGAVAAQLHAAHARMAVPRGESWASMIPLFHCGGCIFSLGVPLFAGGAWVGQPAFDLPELSGLVERERCGGFVGVPTAYLAMLRTPPAERRDLSSLRFAISGGAPPDPAVLAACERALGIGSVHQIYGLTETATTVCCAPAGDPDRAATAGPPLAGIEVRIADPATGEALAAGAIGEIQVRGPTLMRGYDNDSDATAAAFAEGGWLRTGDLGELDGRGYLKVSAGRLKDMLIRGGENVYPVEIEQALQAHAAVAEAAVFGLPDDYYGEVPAAALRLDGSARAGDLAAFLADRLARHKLPVRYFTADDFPRNAAGKVLKADLRAAAQAGRLARLD